tara:strand:- start:1191 stop:1856 length:666 start_codon:yes stop_codon:yes gene_type:complete
MNDHKITYKGIDYIVGEPTIENWKKIILSESFKTPEEFHMDLISISTGLSVDELRTVSMGEILNVMSGLSEYYDNIDKTFHNKITFKGVEYEFANLNDLTFGHFVDIDTFSSKDESFRTQNLEKYMALLYSPKGEDYMTNLRERTELFKELPVRYFQGAQSFFFHLEETLFPPTGRYSLRVIMITLMIRLKRKWNRLLVRIGVGIKVLARWPKTILQRLTK